MAKQPITEEQLDRCMRLVDDRTGEVFYHVESESTDDVYEVHFVIGRGFSCTCPAGASGFRYCRSTCKHCRWCVAHAQEYLEHKKLMAELESEQRELALQADEDYYQLACYEALIQQHPRKPRDAAGVLRTAAQLRNVTYRQPDGSFW